MNMMCLLIKTGNNNVLIDTGWGIGGEVVTGTLISVLQVNGIQPEEIDTIIISHVHPDHIGGNTDIKGNAVFPNARYFIYREEWNFWSSIPSTKQLKDKMVRETHTCVQKNLMQIKNRFTLVGVETEIVPGIKFVSAPGHSLHHCNIEISSGGEKLIYLSDSIHHPIEVPYPDLYVFGDTNPKQAIETKKQIISQVADTNTILFACHFPFPGLGRIIQKGDARVWVSL
jgi:glyoxylase-like metal-dependent hydrolase (beta-lactamase superfamily II)